MDWADEKAAEILEFMDDNTRSGWSGHSLPREGEERIAAALREERHRWVEGLTGLEAECRDFSNRAGDDRGAGSILVADKLAALRKRLEGQ